MAHFLKKVMLLLIPVKIGHIDFLPLSFMLN